jgi:mRNA-degrading endonuclease HigB of HigAB toxin-antitoxin module
MKINMPAATPWRSAQVRYQNGIMMIRFFGTLEEYDQVDAETV